jgi:hypothetical protein
VPRFIGVIAVRLADGFTLSRWAVRPGLGFRESDCHSPDICEPIL